MPSGQPAVIVAAPPAKPWYRSRTLWANAVVLALGGVESQLGLLQPMLPVDVFALLAFALPVVNLVLRFITTQAVEFPGTKPPAQPPVDEEFRL